MIVPFFVTDLLILAMQMNGASQVKLLFLPLPGTRLISIDSVFFAVRSKSHWYLILIAFTLRDNI